MPVALIPLLALAPPQPFDDAVAVWHFADLHDSAGADSALTSGGTATVGLELTGAEREASLARGGDGRVARCDGGWFAAGQGADGELNLTGGAMTLLIRLRDPSGAWDTSLLSKHGGHDKLVYNLFTADLGAGMIVGFELGTSDLRGMVQAKLPLRYVDATAWHDLIVRYDGASLELFCDGARIDAVPVTGALRGGNQEPCLIGAESVGGTPARPFHGELDHAALWQRALTDAEIERLTAGAGPAALAAYLAARDEERRMTLERLAADPLRPRYHFMPPAHWMNDPNGVIQFAGRYHMFYQHNPDGAWHANMHWGHAVSDDLVHWEHLPIALAPTAGTYDQGGIWSGSAVDADGVLTLMYTGVMPESQCLATAIGGGIEFAKHPGNPVIAAPPDGLAVTGFRDPCLWREDDGWHVLIGSGIREVGGVALHYRSDDLTAWDYLGPLLVGDRAVTGEMWECPDFFALGGGHALLVSVHGTVLWMLGDYDGRTFTPTADGHCDWGGHWYAAQECRDAAGRHLAWGWIWEARPRETQIASGWAGVMSLPRVLTRRDDGTLGQEPAPEYERLRGEAWTAGPIELADGGQVLLEPRGDQLELRLEANLDAGATLGLKLRATPDGKEETLLLLDRAADTVSLDRRQSSLDESTGRDVRGGPVRPRPGADEVRLFLDRSVIEVFVNGETCLTSRIYPTQTDSLGLALFATGGAVHVEQVTVWPMADI